ncbi:MAG: MarR family winged helix-turn-helix transcriptional regulator [Methanobrevibacter sp.]|jgi:predicted transcriptional regulator|nr:MarR family winged helix-turn-helix transcriptional regulator [Methanobrevibacter sp.]
MNFSEKLDNLDFENMSIAEIIAIINKTHLIYLSHEIKDLDINIFEIPIISKIKDNGESSLDNLRDNQELNKIHIERILENLERIGIIEIVDVESSYNNKKYKVSLTEKGNKTMLNVEEIEKNWEDLLFKEFKSFNKENFKENLKDLVKNSISIVNKKEILKDRIFPQNFRTFERGNVFPSGIFNRGDEFFSRINESFFDGFRKDSRCDFHGRGEEFHGRKNKKNRGYF